MAIVGLTERYGAAVITGKVGQLFNVVSRLIGAVMAIHLLVIDPFEIHSISVSAGVRCDEFPRGFVLALGAVLRPVIGQGECNFCIVITCDHGVFCTSEVVDGFIHAVVTIVNSIVDPTPRNFEIGTVQLAFSGVFTTMFLIFLIIIPAKPSLGFVASRCAFIHP